jgi:hypothetical protein
MPALVAGISMLKSAALHVIGITGTRPVMTWEGVIPGRSVAEGKGIHSHARRYGSPSLAALAGDDKGGKTSTLLTCAPSRYTRF